VPPEIAAMALREQDMGDTSFVVVEQPEKALPAHANGKANGHDKANGKGQDKGPPQSKGKRK
jgi:hypothetical protein